MVYDINKNQYNYAFDIDGMSLNQAYDLDKNPLLDTTPPVVESFKVMSYNVGSWTKFGEKATTENQETWYTLQNSILSTEDTDLLGIQEYYSKIGNYNVPTMLGQYYPYLFAVDWVSTKAGRAIASKYAMANAREVNFQNQTGEIRSYLIGDISIDGKTIKFITAHLALDEETVIKQIQELLHLVNNYEYWILTGDFNIEFTTAESVGYTNFVRPFLDAGYNVANASVFGFIPTFTTKKPGDDSSWASIDNILCSSNIDMKNVYTNKQKITEHADYQIDHLPLIAEMELNDTSHSWLVYSTSNGSLSKISGAVDSAVTDSNYPNRIRWRTAATARTGIVVQSGVSPYKKDTDYSDSAYYPVPVPEWAKAVRISSTQKMSLYVTFVQYDNSTHTYGDPISEYTAAWKYTTIFRNISKTQNLYMVVSVNSKLSNLGSIDFSISFES